MDIKTLCLGILSLGDATGYEIKKMVAEGSLSFFSEASYGSIYPALGKLMEQNLVTCVAMVQDKRPDKKVYSLTETGREELTRSLRKDPDPDKNRSEFLATILFCESVAPERVTALIQDRIIEHEDKIATLEGLLAGEMTPASRFVVEYGIATQKAALKFLQTHQGNLVGTAAKGAANKLKEVGTPAAE
jgi:DNA-binding PadR family transcriptional regulator